MQTISQLDWRQPSESLPTELRDVLVAVESNGSWLFTVAEYRDRAGSPAWYDYSQNVGLIDGVAGWEKLATLMNYQWTYIPFPTAIARSVEGA